MATPHLSAIQVCLRETFWIAPSVSDPATAVNVWVESPKGKIKEGDRVELHCRGNGNIDSSITIEHKPVRQSAFLFGPVDTDWGVIGVALISKCCHFCRLVNNGKKKFWCCPMWHLRMQDYMPVPLWTCSTTEKSMETSPWKSTVSCDLQRRLCGRSASDSSLITLSRLSAPRASSSRRCGDTWRQHCGDQGREAGGLVQRSVVTADSDSLAEGENPRVRCSSFTFGCLQFGNSENVLSLITCPPETANVGCQNREEHDWDECREPQSFSNQWLTSPWVIPSWYTINSLNTHGFTVVKTGCRSNEVLKVIKSKGLECNFCRFLKESATCSGYILNCEIFCSYFAPRELRSQTWIPQLHFS